MSSNSDGSTKVRTATGLFLALLATIFVAETIAHAIANAFHLPLIQESLFDAFSVTLLSYPAMLILVFRPFSRAITKCERSEKLKDEFIGTVSHELRTPLSISKEGISLVLDKIPGPINEEQARILTISKKNMERLARIINSLLDISRIESGKIRAGKEAFNIIPITMQVIRVFEPKIRDKGLGLRADLPQNDIIVHGDPDGIAHALTNLISNALKFTDRGEVRISVKNAGENVEISVADTGVGIAKNNIPKLFEKFQQFARVDGPGEKGTGLGMAIARGIVAAHKGRIWAESEPGKGTKITFTLPKNV